MIACTPYLLNSARLHKVFQNFVVPRKIHLSQNLILSSEASRQDASNGVRVAYVNFYNMWAYDKVKDYIEVTKIPEYEKIDETPVNHLSDWTPNTS